MSHLSKKVRVTVMLPIESHERLVKIRERLGKESLAIENPPTAADVIERALREFESNLDCEARRAERWLKK